MATWEEEQRLARIEQSFEADDPGFAKALREGVPRPACRAPVCAVADVLGVGVFVTAVVLQSLLLLGSSALLVVVALGLHIFWPPG